MNRKLTLFFNTDKNGAYLLTIPNASYPVNTQKVNAAMDTIIASSSIVTKNGTPISKKKAVLSTRTTTTLLETEN